MSKGFGGWEESHENKIGACFPTVRSQGTKTKMNEFIMDIKHMRHFDFLGGERIFGQWCQWIDK